VPLQTLRCAGAISFSPSTPTLLLMQERYSKVPLDLALRKLLAQFRLPGEAQKIDRIMEKVRCVHVISWGVMPHHRKGAPACASS